jgi:hypothetical protein
MSVVKHGKQSLDNHRRARSRPNYSDDFSNEFELRHWIVGLLFPIGNICRRIVGLVTRWIPYAKPPGSATRSAAVGSKLAPEIKNPGG